MLSSVESYLSKLPLKATRLIDRTVAVAGMAFGGGSAVAHRAVDAVMGPRTVHAAPEAPSAAAEPAQYAGNSAAQFSNSSMDSACSNQTKSFRDVSCRRSCFFDLLAGVAPVLLVLIGVHLYDGRWWVGSCRIGSCKQELRLATRIVSASLACVAGFHRKDGFFLCREGADEWHALRSRGLTQRA